MSNQTGKPVTLICINPFKHDGKHIAVDEVLVDVPAEDALEFTGAGRTRLAKDAEDIAAAKKRRNATVKAESAVAAA